MGRALRLGQERVVGRRPETATAPGQRCSRARGNRVYSGWLAPRFLQRVLP